MARDRGAKMSGSGAKMGRRAFLAGAAALAGPVAARGGSPRRVAVIGHTGRGNYGHDIDTVWLSVPGVEVVAVADPDERGRAAAVSRLGGARGFEDYRRMLREVRPELVGICPRWIDQHREMVLAAVESGVRGIYLEKPLCRSLEEADEMVRACEARGVKLAVAHQTRYSPKLAVVRRLLREGAVGRVLEFRGRGKEDRRGGGEDLWVLGTHVLDLIASLGGAPLWCFGSVRAEGRPIGPADVKPGNEGIGPLAGDEVRATFGLSGGALATFDSVRDAGGQPSRFGLWIFGSQGVIELHTGYLPDVYLLRDSSWSPGRTGSKWIPVSSAGPGAPEPLRDGGLPAGNMLAVEDLIASVEEDRQPVSNLREARTATEMIAATFESQRVGGPVKLPLANRANPLSALAAAAPPGEREE